MRQKRHDRKTHGPLAANNHAGGYGGSLGRAPAHGCAGQSIGKNDAAASRISGHAERHLQLRNLHAVRAAEFLQGGRTATSARTAGAKPSRSRIDFTLPWRALQGRVKVTHSSLALENANDDTRLVFSSRI